jgi:signal transduction histidine kinase
MKTQTKTQTKTETKTQTQNSSIVIDAVLIQKILDSLPIGVWVANTEGVLVANNPAGQAVWQGERWIGVDQYSEYKGWWSDTGKRIAAEEWGMARAVMKGEMSLNEMVDIECFDGTRKTILNSAMPILDDDGKMLVAIAINQDITELKKTQDALMLARRHLEALSAASLDVQENERKHLSMELHDEIGQTLTALKIMIETARRKSTGECTGDGIEQLLQQAVETVDSLVGDVRNIARRLRPPSLDDLGLPAALRWHLDNLSRTAQVAIRLTETLHELRLEPALELGCFRIAQEAVSNALRHAGAAQISVSIECNAQHLMLRVVDDGCGFSPELVYTTTQHYPLGLLGMRERAAGLGGELHINATRGHGTEIACVFPLAQPA